MRIENRPISTEGRNTASELTAPAFGRWKGRPEKEPTRSIWGRKKGCGRYSTTAPAGKRIKTH